MNVKSFLVFLLLLCVLFAGCGQKEETHYCAICGSVATRSISGSAYSLKNMGIPLSNCEEITSLVYSAHLCDSCCDYPVFALKPDP